MNGINYNYHIVKYLMSKKELNELYVSMVLRTLAFSMIGVFVPLFLFKELSYSLQEIIYYYIVYSFSFLISTPIGAKLGNYIGIKHVILFSTPLFIFYFAFLYLLESNPAFFFIIPVIYGIADGIFWISFHIDFSMFSEEKTRGKQIGKYYSFALLAGLIGPMIGGVILTVTSFNLLFSIVSLLLIGSAVPLFFTKDVKRKYKFSWNFMKAGSIRDLCSFIGVGSLLIVEGVFWPIFIFSILGLYVAMGSLYSLLGVVSLLVTYVTGKLVDVFDKRKLVKVFSFSNSIVWIVNIFIKTKLELISVSTIMSITSIAMNIPYTAIMYNKCGKNVEYLVFREFGLCIGRVIVLLLVLATGSLLSSFLFGAIASLGYMLL